MQPYVCMGYMVVYIKSQNSKKIHLDSKLDFNWSPIFAQHVHLYIYFFLILWQMNYWVQKPKSLNPTKF